MRGTLGALLALIASVSLAGAAAAQQRIALVIGNQDYPASLGRLEHTRDDARRIATALKAVGFELVSAGGADASGAVLDADRAGMQAAVDAFVARLERSPGAIAFFYFSGHGTSARVGGGRTNLLIPVKENIDVFSQIPLKALRLNDLVDALENTRAKAVLVVSDACREELAVTGEQGRDKGYSAIPSRPRMLIAYAAAEGATTPDDGLFARKLADEIVRPGQDVSVAFVRATQEVASGRADYGTPYFTSSIAKDVCFKSCPGEAVATTAAAAATADAPEKLAYEMAKTPCDFAAFADAYPKSVLAPLARLRQAGCSAATTAPSAPLAARPDPGAPAGLGGKVTLRARAGESRKDVVPKLGLYAAYYTSDGSGVNQRYVVPPSHDPKANVDLGYIIVVDGGDSNEARLNAKDKFFRRNDYEATIYVVIVSSGGAVTLAGFYHGGRDVSDQKQGGDVPPAGVYKNFPWSMAYYDARERVLLGK